MEPSPHRPTRKERKRAREETRQQKTTLELGNVSPLTSNQRRAFDTFWKNKHLMLHGCAGTGKSFISLYLALQAVLTDGDYDKVVIVRSVVPTRVMGFLPGKERDKVKVYEAPYYAICQELFRRGDAYEVLKTQNKVEFISTSFIRGITLSNCVVIVDEVQNLTSHEANSIITRVGKNTRVIFSGDIRQSDLNKGREYSGLYDFIKIIRKMKSFEFIEFTTDDIVRSALVRDYILTRNELEDADVISPLSRAT